MYSATVVDEDDGNASVPVTLTNGGEKLRRPQGASLIQELGFVLWGSSSVTCSGYGGMQPPRSIAISNQVDFAASFLGGNPI